MTIPAQSDIVVIGGGPAGSLTATFLAQKGYDVVLFEKKKHPRYNVGESIIPHFWKYCELAGVGDKMRAERFIQKVGGTVAWEGTVRQMAFRNFGHTEPALHVERDRFDEILSDHAREQGARVFERVTVTKVDVGGAPRVTYRVTDEGAPGGIACRYVVDASGQGAVIAKELGIRVIDEGFRFMSVWGYFLDSKYVAGDGKVYPFDRLRSVPPTTFVTSVGTRGTYGWGWHIPLRESTSVGLVLPVDQMKGVTSNGDLERYFVDTCYRMPYFGPLLEGAKYCEGSFHGIRDYSYLPTQLVGPGFFLIGDAAAFIDPIFSVGAVLAMYSGYLATWAIDNALKNPSRASHYESLFASQLRARLEVARALALPSYGGAPSSGDQAKTAIQFETSLEQELMFVASTLTSRSENFLKMARNKDGSPITSDRVRILEGLDF